MKTYEITGVVYGNLWGGGEGAYPSRPLQGDNLAELTKKAKKMLKDGSLDGGMGYESLNGAYLNIETKTIKTIDGDEFINKKYDDMFIGKLSDKVKDFLQFECQF